MTLKKLGKNKMYICPKCKSSIELQSLQCNSCGLEFKYNNSHFVYNYDRLLFDKYKNRFLRNKSLNNNGLISYLLLEEGSLSLENREDVRKFRSFIETQLEKDKKYKILDIGCGLMELPGYLSFEQIKNVELLGLEPIESSKFKGELITGCSEFIPLEEDSVDVVIFATSIDHVCSIKDSINEVKRVLKKDGKVFVWMSNNEKNVLAKLKSFIKIVFDYVKYGYRTDKYRVFNDYKVVLEVPKGGVDPFHSFFESPKIIEEKFKKSGFGMTKQTINNKDEVFLTFEINN